MQCADLLNRARWNERLRSLEAVQKQRRNSKMGSRQGTPLTEAAVDDRDPVPVWPALPEADLSEEVEAADEYDEPESGANDEVAAMLPDDEPLPLGTEPANLQVVPAPAPSGPEQHTQTSDQLDPPDN